MSFISASSVICWIVIVNGKTAKSFLWKTSYIKAGPDPIENLRLKTPIIL
jgi:hypothetical protein